ncbi:MAG: glycosyltransferase family 39 protein [Sandaracinaceae bacterium]|nr:glycosyltransferase family 39 protein [Sandaracinaceae bacterium]
MNQAKESAFSPLFRPSEPKAWDHAIALALSIAYVIALFLSVPDLGMSRDEGFYVDAAESYASWFRLLLSEPEEALRRETIDRFWSVNHEHPSLPKSLFALSWLAHKKWDLFPYESLAFRFPGMLLSSLALYILYLFGTRLYGRLAGLYAALAYALVPAVFYHSHLACFDTPIVSMLLLVTYLYHRALTHKKWIIPTGIAYGLCLETKHNSWILPLLFLVHFCFVIENTIASNRLTLRGGIARLIPWPLIGILLIGPPIFIGLWPWLWHDTISRIEEYVAFHVHHVHYNIAYLGRTYFSPPSPPSYPWVTTLFTLPLITIFLGVVGIFLRFPLLLPRSILRFWPRSTPFPDPARSDVLVFGSFFTPMFVMMMPWTPIFGGTKHFLVAYAMLALFGGHAFSQLVEEWEGRIQVKLGISPFAFRAFALCLALASPLVATAHSHPFGLSYYTPIAGGVPGAADLGMNRQFWGFTTGSLVPWLNAHIPPHGRVWICDTLPTSFYMLKRDALLRPDIEIAWDLLSSDYALVHHEDHFNIVDYQIWEVYGMVNPVHVLTYDGVPIISVYENPHRKARRP